MRGKRADNLRVFLLVLFFIVGVAVFVFGASISGYDVEYSLSEQAGNTPYLFNFSLNVTLSDGEVVSEYSIDDSQEHKIYLNGNQLLIEDISSWINFNSSNGLLILNSTHDNQTGKLKLPLSVTTSGAISATYRAPYNFTINATNDLPEWGVINSTYLFPQDRSEPNYVSVVDEEEHYPMKFNVTFFEDNCTHASWSGMNNDENCSLWDFDFNLSDVTPNSFEMTLPANNSYVGVYWANISATESVISCPHDYCDADYLINQTIIYPNVKFEIEAMLEINASDCNGAGIEGEEYNCTVEVRTRKEADNIEIKSLGDFVESYTPYVERLDWFYSSTMNTSEDFFLSIPVSVTPTKRDVGNWSIVIFANDSRYPVNDTFNVFVNYTESPVLLDAVEYIEVYENKTFYVSAYDDDFFVRDKSVKNEVLDIGSNTSWVNVNYLSELSGGKNYSVLVDYDSFKNDGSFEFNQNYSVLINVSDLAGNNDSKVIEIFMGNNTRPEWNLSKEDYFIIYEDNLTEIDLVGEGYVWDNEGDPISFSCVSGCGSGFESSWISSGGIISFTPEDENVGYHNITIRASDSTLYAIKSFNFTILNVHDSPEILDVRLEGGVNSLGGVIEIIETNFSNFFLNVLDDDFRIIQKNFYDEKITLNISFRNLSSGQYIEHLFSFVEGEPLAGIVTFEANFTPNKSHVGFYNVTINTTDKSNISEVNYFILNITEINNLPILDEIDNFTSTIFDSLYYEFNATDIEEDLKNERNLTYEIYNLSVGGDFINSSNFNSSSGIVNVSNLSEFSGKWHYNLTVTDSGGEIDYQDFWIYIYGFPEILSSENIVYNLTENVTEYLEFNFSHAVEDNLTYEFWTDFLTCEFQNSSSCNYSNMTYREIDFYFGDGRLFNKSFTPDFTDETYGNLKNLTLVVYPNSSLLNESQRESLKTNFSFNLNVSHTNAPTRFICNYIEDKSTTWDKSLDYNLSTCFLDEDSSDPFYLQEVNLRVVSNSSSSNVDVNDLRIGFPEVNISHNSWQVSFSTSFRTSEFSERITLYAGDIDNSTGLLLNTAISNPFTISFTEPGEEVITKPKPSGGGTSGSSTSESEVLKHYSLKIVTPMDVIISDQNYIDIPFSISNTGQVDLFGINLSSIVSFNDEFTEDVRISLGEDYIPELKLGQSEEFTMRIIANTQKSGKYKATIYANVTSPMFNDWGDFFIELKRVNETEAEQILIFTEKLVADNPECLELTEHLKSAKRAYESGDYDSAILLANEVVVACEDSIQINEQIRYRLEGFVQKNFFYILYITLGVFLMGFIFYLYKRARFNKSKIGEYI